jgi:hypothetical protein
MDYYHIWCNLKPGVGDLDFCARVSAYLGQLRDEGLIAAFHVARRKLGFGPRTLGEFHIRIDVENLAQLDRAFERASARAGRIEELHAAVYQSVCDLTLALYRDFPDEHRAPPEKPA